MRRPMLIMCFSCSRIVCALGLQSSGSLHDYKGMIWKNKPEKSEMIIFIWRRNIEDFKSPRMFGKYLDQEKKYLGIGHYWKNKLEPNINKVVKKSIITILYRNSNVDVDQVELHGYRVSRSLKHIQEAYILEILNAMRTRPSHLTLHRFIWNANAVNNCCLILILRISWYAHANLRGRHKRTRQSLIEKQWN